MKKIFAICLVAMLFATGTVGARNHFNAPKTMNEWTYYCQWDSAHRYYEDSVLEERTYIQEIDTVNNTVLVYAVEWNDYKSIWRSLHVHKYFYDAQGRLTLYLDCEPDSEDFSDYTFNDSTIYIYGNQERTEIRYYTNNVTTYMMDSTHYALDAMDSVLEKVHYFYKNDSTILSIDKNTYTYDPASHLMLTDSAFAYDNETGWFATTANIYTLNDGKYVSGIQYSFLREDTMYRCEYVYDADNIAEIDFYYRQSDGTLQSYIGEKELYTYNDCGDVLIFETYGNNGDGFYFTGREQQFYTTKQIETAVEDVTEEPEAVRDEVVVKKYMINGQLFIERNGITYDAQGRVVRR